MNEAGASSKGLSPGKCQTTGDRRAMRRKWSQEENRVVMQYYFRSDHGRNGYRKRIHTPYGIKWECLM